MQNIPAPPPGYMLDPNDPTRAIPMTQGASPFGNRPVIRQQEDPYKVADQRLQEDAAARAQEASRRSELEWNATHNPDGTPKPAAKGLSKIPTTVVSGIQANLENIRAIDAAIAKLKSRPQSIGPGTGALGDTFTQFNDPEGQDVRSRVGQIGAVKIHDLSGAAVSATEAPRFQPFVPTVQDRPEIALQKLEQFREALKAQTQEITQYYTPQNGFQPYDTPRAQTLNAPQSAQGPTEGGFGLKQDPNLSSLKPEQAAAYDAWFKANPNATPDQLSAFGHSLNLNIPPENAKAILSYYKQTGSLNHDVQQIDPRVTEKVAQLKQNGAATDAAAVGIENGITLNGAGEIAAAGAALKGSLSGQGSFGDLYNVNSQANQQYEDSLRQDHPVASVAGELGGGLALAPLTFGAETPAQLAALSGGMGAVGGFNAGSGSIGNRAANALVGGAAGAALGYAIPKGVSMLPGKAQGAVPELVDPTTGSLNQPLEAMRPGDRVSAAKDFGIDLPMDAAGGRPAAIIGKGLDIMPGSAGVMEDARRATEQQVAGAADRVAAKAGQARTLNEAGAELQRGANQYIDRGRQVIGKAYNAIPISPQAPTSTGNTVAALTELTSRLSDNPDLQQQVGSKQLQGFLDAIQKNGLTWQSMKQLRSFIGEKIGERLLSDDATTKDLRAVYGALSEDMRNTAANMGPGASRAFERANNLNRQHEMLIENSLKRILGNDNNLRPEAAAAAIQAMTKGGKSTGDLKTLAQIKAATVKSGAWDEIAGTLIRLGGQPANSQGRDFNPQTFVQWYADMAEPARAMLFKPEVRKSLDQFVAVNQRLMKVNALRNTSNTAGSMVAAGTVGTLAAAAANPLLGVKLLGVMAGNYGMAKVWTNPAFVKWATGFSKAAVTGNGKSQIGRLQAIAASNPEIREPLIELQKKLLSAANDNVGRVAASPQDNQSNQQ